MATILDSTAEDLSRVWNIAGIIFTEMDKISFVGSPKFSL